MVHAGLWFLFGKGGGLTVFVGGGGGGWNESRAGHATLPFSGGWGDIHWAGDWTPQNCFKGMDIWHKLCSTGGGGGQG